MKRGSLQNYRVWLTEAANYYGVDEEDIRGSVKIKEVARARHLFYWLCWRDGINLSRLSVHLGKDRTTVGGTINKSFHLRNREAENLIYEKISFKKSLEEKEAENKRRKRGFCSYVAILDKLVPLSTSWG